jgi:hypothetical protein
MWKNSKDTIVIPNKFTIAGSTYNINIVENSEKDLGGALGDFTNIFHEIRIAKTCRFGEDVIDIPKDEFIKTYLHELGHCFGYYYKGDDSEEFANAFANFFYEYLHTKE